MLIECVPIAELASFGTIYTKGRARYWPIDDRARYWANFFLDEVWKIELRKFSEKKKYIYILWGLEPMLVS